MDSREKPKGKLEIIAETGGALLVVGAAVAASAAVVGAGMIYDGYQALRGSYPSNHSYRPRVF